jgi:ribose 5-phosphate isomerase B
MKLYIGADHRGFKLKEELKPWLKTKGYEIEDCGNTKFDPADDYPDYASRVAEGVKNSSHESKGILLCGSGIGVCIVANKYAGIRCGLGIDTEHTRHGRLNDNINVLALPADLLTESQAKDMVTAFLTTDFSTEERFLRRQSKIEEIEKA